MTRLPLFGVDAYGRPVVGVALTATTAAVGRCGRCGKAIAAGARYRRWVEPDPVVPVHEACAVEVVVAARAGDPAELAPEEEPPPPRYRPPARRRNEVSRNA